MFVSCSRPDCVPAGAPFIHVSSIHATAASSCTANKASAALFKKTWFTHDPEATATTARIPAVFRLGRGSVSSRFEVTIKPQVAIGAGKELCINIPADVINKCSNLSTMCGGGRQCGFNITTARFKAGKKYHTCCIQGLVSSDGEWPVGI